MSNKTTFIPVEATTLKETEKAYQLRVSYWTTERAPIKTADMWVPKSCAQVTDGKVSAIADWILNKWADQRAEHITYRASKYSVRFDIDGYHARIEAEKEKARKWKEEVDLTVATIVESVTPYSIDFMAELADCGHLVYNTFKNSDILTAEELTSLKSVSDRMEKAYGKWSKADDPKTKEFEKEFPSKYTTLKQVADFLWLEVDFPTLGVKLYNSDVRRQLKLPNGNLVSDNTLFNVLQGYETSIVGKKFKKNFAFHKEFKKIVIDIMNREFASRDK